MGRKEVLMTPRCSDIEFINHWHATNGSPVEIQKILQIDVRKIYERRRSIESRHNIKLESGKKQLQAQVSKKVRARLTVENGTVIIASDCHYWPGIVSTAHRALCKLVHKLKPVANIMNGDVVDGATISRHPRIGWEKRPDFHQEVEAAEDRLDEIDKSSLNSKNFWTFGNHDGLFEYNIANKLPDYKNIKGFSLKDHFPRWTPCMSVMINESVMVKHRYKGGVHATHNNTVNAGISIVTGHLHSLKVTPFDDFNGTRYGVDTGTLADPWGPQFEAYMEDNARNWRSGFAVLEFRDGKLMPPDLCQVIEEDAVWFRGNRIEV
jgi:hypothetical protein